MKANTKIVLCIAAFLFFAAGAFVAWVATGPRAIPYLPHMIEKEFSTLNSQYTITVDETLLKWHGFSNPVGIHVTHFGVLDKEGKQIASFPDTRIRISVLALLRGRIVIRDLEIEGPELSVSYDASRWNLKQPLAGMQVEKTPYSQLVFGLLSAIEANDRHIPIRNIHLRNARLILNNGICELAWVVPQWKTELFVLEGKYVAFRTLMNVTNLRQENSAIGASGYLGADKSLHMNIKAGDIDTAFVTDLFPRQQWLARMGFVFDAEGNMALGGNGELKNADFHVASKEGRFPQVDVSGKVIHPESAKNAMPRIEVDAMLYNLPIGRLEEYWPPFLANEAREWVTANVTAGTATSGSLRLVVRPEDIEAGVLPREAVDATVHLADLAVDYFSPLPRLTGASGIATFDADSMFLTVREGKTEDSEATGEVVIHNLSKDDTAIEIKGKLKGPARDLIAVRDKLMEMEDPRLKNISGQAVTRYALRFPLDDSLHPEQVGYTLSSHLTDVGMGEVVKGIVVTGGDFDLRYENNEAKLFGKAFANGVPVEVEYKQYVDRHKLGQEEYNIRSYVTPEELKKLGLPEMSFLEGALGVNFSIAHSAAETRVSGKLDAKDAVVSFPQFGWSKKPGEAADVAFVALKKEENIFRFESFDLTAAGGLSASGTGEFSPDDPENWRVFLEKMRHGNTDLAVRIIKEKARPYVIDVKGGAWDLVPIIQYQLSSEAKRSDLPFDLRVSIEKAMLFNGVEVRNVSGMVRCAPQCETLHLRGSVGDKPVQAILTQAGAGRRLMVASGDAGALLGGLDIMRHIRGGDMEMSASWVDEGGSIVFRNGKLRARDFRVVKAPALAKLLSLGSLTGILDLLNGDGISFAKLKGEFAVEKGTVTLREVKASGNALGLTTSGVIDTGNSMLNLEGVIIPAYYLNSVFGNVPLVGEILVGREGEGVIATNYSMEGPLVDPSVTVNPLSMLTPGFLRGIWDGLPEK